MGAEDDTTAAADLRAPHRRTLLIVGPDLSASHALPESGVITIGRSRECEVRVDHPSISRRHLSIRIGEGIEVEDLGSANGSRFRDKELVQGQRVHVRSGEVIDVGAVMVIVQEPLQRRPSDGREPPIGSMVQLERLVERVAEGNITVLITGETGVGKEVLAGRIHELSPRRGRPFVRINSAAFTESLLESELFGYERGAFTGADRAKPGLLATADGGTVLLDEIGELPAATQVKLLRVLEQREILPIGGLKPVPIDVRFIAATNRDLEQEVQRGAFRQDLYFRLAGITLRVPPLRERAEEIPRLAAGFVARASEELKRARVPVLSDEALRLLARYSWPGNIRELRNAIERAVLLCTDDTITAEHIPVDKGEAAARDSRPQLRPSGDLREEVDRIERERILHALDECGGNQTQTARMLGISRSKLISRIEEYGIRRPRKRDA